MNTNGPEPAPGREPARLHIALLGRFELSDAGDRIAKTYSGADAPGFVNGILGAIHREMGHNPAQP